MLICLSNIFKTKIKVRKVCKDQGFSYTKLNEETSEKSFKNHKIDNGQFARGLAGCGVGIFFLAFLWAMNNE